MSDNGGRDMVVHLRSQLRSWWRKITDYGSIERACIILTNIGGSKNLGIVLQDCKAVSDNRGNRPRIEGLGQ